MVTEMLKYNFILLSGDMEGFLKKLQSLGVVDITRSTKPIDENSEKLSARADVLRRSLTALKEIVPAEKAGAKPKDTAAEILSLKAEKESMQAGIPQLLKEIEDRKQWGLFD